MMSTIRALSFLLAVLALPALACSLAANAPVPEPTEEAPTKFARAVILNTPPVTVVVTTAPSTPTSPPLVTIQRAVASPATAPLATPTRTATTIATLVGGCPTIPSPALKPSGWIKNIILGMKNSGSALVTPMTIFQTAATIHAIVGLQNAPAKTRVKTAWYANDVGKAAPCNKLVDSAELGDLSGSIFVDYTLDPPHPAGIYRVEIYVNGNFDQAVPFSVK